MAAERVERTLEVLSTTKKIDWEDREGLLIELQSLIKAQGDAGTELPRDVINKLRQPLDLQIKDLRSSIVREACRLIVVCSESIGLAFSRVASSLLNTLLDGWLFGRLISA